MTAGQLDLAWLSVEPTVAGLHEHLRSSERSLVLRSSALGSYRRPLIATDLDRVDTVLPALRVCSDTARIAVLSPYRIPFASLHTLPRALRLETELKRATIDTDLASIEQLVARLGELKGLLFLFRIRFGLFSVLSRPGAVRDWSAMERAYCEHARVAL